MNIFRYLLIALTIIFCHSADCMSETTHIIHRYGKAEGLSNLSVHSIAQDTNGFIWIGTSHVLDRYDGSHIRHYSVPRMGGAENKDDHRITALCASRNGKIWVGTSCTLFWFDPQKETFHHIEDKTLQDIAAITKIMEDKEGNIWIISATALMCLDTQTEKVNSYPDFTSSDIIETQNGIIWSTSFDGSLCRFDPTKKHFIKYPILNEEDKKQHAFLVSLEECDNGYIAIATNKMGVKAFSPSEKKVSLLIDSKENEEPITIHCMAYSQESQLWIGTEQGVRVYSINFNEQPVCQLVKSFKKDYSNPNSLSDNAIHSLLLDKDNGCWVGTFFGGLNHIFNNKRTIHQYLPLNEKTGVVEANIIREIHPDHKGHLWIGTEDGGLAKFDLKTHDFRMKTLLHNGTKVVNIQSLCIDEDHIWVGSYMNGLLKVNLETLQIVNQYPYLNTNNVVCILKINPGELLLGTFSGLFYLNEKTKSAYKVPGLENYFIHTMYKDTEEQIWIGTFSDGLFKLSNNGHQLIAEKTSFSRFGIGTIFEDSNKNLYIGTNGTGLYLYDEKKNLTTPVVLSWKGEDDFSVCNIQEDHFGRLWVSTFDGLYCYDNRQGAVAHLTNDNGLPTSQFNFASGYKSENGNLYFGTYQGLISMQPKEMLQEEVIVPKVLFTGVKTTDFESGYVKDTLTLKHHQASFSLDFSTTTPSSLGFIWYRYRLKGKDQTWTLCKGTQRIQFAGLTPGTYILEVQASLQNNVWNGNPTTLTITITPPFWKHPLAYLTYIILLIILLYLTVRWYKRRTSLRHQLQIKELQTQKQSEVLQAKISFFTTITHEIRTPLTLIMGCIDKLHDNGDKTLQILRNNTKRLLDLVNQLLDFRKIESARMLMNFTELDIHHIIKEICDNFSPLSIKKGINVSINLDPASVIVVADKESVIKMISNMLANAYKFCQNQVWVSTKISKDGNHEMLSVRISNDGIRIPQEQEEEIFKPFVQYYYNNIQSPINGSGLGLPLIRSLAELTNGKFYLDHDVKDLNSSVLQLPIQHQCTQTISHATTEEKDEKNELSYSTSNGKRNILLVDDEADLRAFVAEELETKYNVYEADNGREALRILHERNIQLVITDLMMPVMDGITLCKEMKTDIRLSHIPVIVLTAKVSMQDHIDVLNTNADAYIEKPFSTEHLNAQISNLIHSRELLRETFIHSPYAMITDVGSNKIENEFLKKMDTFINEHIYENISVDTLSDYMAMSNSTLYRKMKGLTSLAPNDYIRLCRLKTAARLLKEEDLSIKEISEKLNFSTVSYFTNCFMKQFGVTPGVFKKSK